MFADTVKSLLPDFLCLYMEYIESVYSQCKLAAVATVIHTKLKVIVYLHSYLIYNMHGCNVMQVYVYIA